MRNYIKGETIEWSNYVPRTVNGLLNTYETNEVRIVQVKKSKPLKNCTYEFYTLKEGRFAPPVEGFEWMTIATREQLVKTLDFLLETERESKSLPKEILVTNPQCSPDTWGIFFKR